MESARSNYNDRVVALRYVYVLALSVWFGGIIMVGAVVAPLPDAALHRFSLASSIAGALVVTTLFAMALLGPRPSSFFARLAVALGMLALTLYSGFERQTLSMNLLLPTAVGGLALLFWEALDGTRAA